MANWRFGPLRESSPPPKRQSRNDRAERDLGDWFKTFWYVPAALLVVGLAVLLLWKTVASRIEIHRGQAALAAGNANLAAQFFTSAVEADPNSMDARLNLARVMTSEYISGGDSPENAQIARGAHDELDRVLTRRPDNGSAIESLAALYYKEGKFEDARQWYRKTIVAHADRKEAHCRLGLMARSEFYPIRLTARSEAGMAPEDPGPISNAAVVRDLRAAWLSKIDEGIDDFQKALAIDKSYEEAMTGLSLLLRDRADLASDSAQYSRDLQASAEWAGKAAEVRRLNAAAGGGER
jgi:tetratricopeptide (TPR) repeat protein